MQFMRLIVSNSNRDRCFIIKMDQTPVYFTVNAKKTLEVIGKKTINVCRLTNDTKQLTIAVTIRVDSTLLPSTLVYKGKLVVYL
jgi:hypothetical protein